MAIMKPDYTCWIINDKIVVKHVLLSDIIGIYVNYDEQCTRITFKTKVKY